MTLLSQNDPVTHTPQLAKKSANVPSQREIRLRLPDEPGIPVAIDVAESCHAWFLIGANQCARLLFSFSLQALALQA